MRVAVVSDIHSNLHALEAVLAAIEAEAPDELWCLGDVVGYGPRPNECCALVAERADICLAGNHDLAIVGAIDLDEFNGDVALYHGSARDHVWEYVLSDEAASATLAIAASSLVLVGHSHIALRFNEREGGLAPAGTTIELGDAPTLLNPGSVGQ